MTLMCPHCGQLTGTGPDQLTPHHNWPAPTRQLCPGSKQIPRNPEGDRRVLWNGQPNPHLPPRNAPTVDPLNHGYCTRCGDLGCRCDANQPA